ncbi:MAG TPA: sulfurtransferase TusA family protein, partial [Usitatibacter sp.]|nr:sulfurtransferase TusA family protein [Usitatibacter sp.]
MSVTTATLQEPAAMVDLTGLHCPGPVLGAKDILEALKEGQVLLLLSDCPGTRDDLFAWARQTGNEVIRTEARARGATAYYVRKGRGVSIPVHTKLDLRGALCPGPIVEAKQLLKGMGPGEVLKLVSDCPGIEDDIVDWARVTGIEIAAIGETETGAHEFYLRKRPA